MKFTTMVAVAALCLPSFAMAQTAADLANGAKDTGNVVNYGMGYDLQRFSALKQIDKTTVKRLAPVWNYSLDDSRAEQSQPIVYKGILYVTTNSATIAIDVKSGSADADIAYRLPQRRYRLMVTFETFSSSASRWHGSMMFRSPMRT